MSSKQTKRKRLPAKKPTPAPDIFELLRGGTQALQRGQIGAAVELLEHAHQLDPHDNDTILNLSGAYILSKKFKQAATLLEELSQREAQNPMVWTNLGAAYLGNPVLAKDENQMQAIEAFKQALALDPNAPNVAYNIGLIYVDRKDTDQALHWFREALKTNPNDKDARRYIDQISKRA